MPARNAIRDAEALGCRAQGHTYDRIAAEMGYSDRSAARKAVQRAIASSVRETTDEAKALILADLNAAKQAAWKVLEANHLTVSNGRVIRVDGAPVPDDAPVLNAIDRIVKINAEIAKILGAYAPARHEVLTIDAIDAEIAQLERELGSGQAGQAAPAPGTAG